MSIFKRGTDERNEDEIQILQIWTSHFKFFQELNSKQSNVNLKLHRKCCTRMKYERVKKGTVVFSAGDLPEKFYIVLTGAVNVMLPKPKEQIQNEVNEEKQRQKFWKAVDLKKAVINRIAALKDRREQLRKQRKSQAILNSPPQSPRSARRHCVDFTPQYSSFGRVGTSPSNFRASIFNSAAFASPRSNLPGMSAFCASPNHSANHQNFSSVIGSMQGKENIGSSGSIRRIDSNEPSQRGSLAMSDSDPIQSHTSIKDQVRTPRHHVDQSSSQAVIDGNAKEETSMDISHFAEELTEGELENDPVYKLLGSIALDSISDFDALFLDGVLKFKYLLSLKPGSMFGELGLLLKKPRAATILAQEDTEFAVLDAEDYSRILSAGEMRIMNQRINFFSEHFLQGCGREIVTKYSYNFKCEKYVRGNYIYTQRDNADFVYIIKKGLIEISQDQADKQDQLEGDRFVKKLSKHTSVRLSTLTIGSCFGEIEIIKGTKRITHAICESVKATLWVLPSSIFVKLIQENRFLTDSFKKQIKLKESWYHRQEESHNFSKAVHASSVQPKVRKEAQSFLKFDHQTEEQLEAHKNDLKRDLEALDELKSQGASELVRLKEIMKTVEFSNVRKQLQMRTLQKNSSDFFFSSTMNATGTTAAAVAPLNANAQSLAPNSNSNSIIPPSLSETQYHEGSPSLKSNSTSEAQFHPFAQKVFNTMRKIQQQKLSSVNEKYKPNNHHHHLSSPKSPQTLPMLDIKHSIDLSLFKPREVIFKSTNNDMMMISRNSVSMPSHLLNELQMPQQPSGRKAENDDIEDNDNSEDESERTHREGEQHAGAAADDTLKESLRKRHSSIVNVKQHSPNGMRRGTWLEAPNSPLSPVAVAVGSPKTTGKSLFSNAGVSSFQLKVHYAKNSNNLSLPSHFTTDIPRSDASQNEQLQTISNSGVSEESTNQKIKASKNSINCNPLRKMLIQSSGVETIKGLSEQSKLNSIRIPIENSESVMLQTVDVQQIPSDQVSPAGIAEAAKLDTELNQELLLTSKNSTIIDSSSSRGGQLESLFIGISPELREKSQSEVLSWKAISENRKIAMQMPTTVNSVAGNNQASQQLLRHNPIIQQQQQSTTVLSVSPFFFTRSQQNSNIAKITQQLAYSQLAIGAGGNASATASPKPNHINNSSLSQFQMFQAGIHANAAAGNPAWQQSYYSNRSCQGTTQKGSCEIEDYDEITEMSGRSLQKSDAQKLQFVKKSSDNSRYFLANQHKTVADCYASATASTINHKKSDEQYSWDREKILKGGARILSQGSPIREDLKSEERTIQNNGMYRTNVEQFSSGKKKAHLFEGSPTKAANKDQLIKQIGSNPKSNKLLELFLGNNGRRVVAHRSNNSTLTSTTAAATATTISTTKHAFKDQTNSEQILRIVGNEKPQSMQMQMQSTSLHQQIQRGVSLQGVDFPVELYQTSSNYCGENDNMEQSKSIDFEESKIRSKATTMTIMNGKSISTTSMMISSSGGKRSDSNPKSNDTSNKFKLHSQQPQQQQQPLFLPSQPNQTPALISRVPLQGDNDDIFEQPGTDPRALLEWMTKIKFRGKESKIHFAKESEVKERRLKLMKKQLNDYRHYPEVVANQSGVVSIPGASGNGQVNTTSSEKRRIDEEVEGIESPLLVVDRDFKCATVASNPAATIGGSTGQTTNRLKKQMSVPSEIKRKAETNWSDIQLVYSQKTFCKTKHNLFRARPEKLFLLHNSLNYATPNPNQQPNYLNRITNHNNNSTSQFSSSCSSVQASTGTMQLPSTISRAEGVQLFTFDIPKHHS